MKDLKHIWMSKINTDIYTDPVFEKNKDQSLKIFLCLFEFVFSY